MYAINLTWEQSNEILKQAVENRLQLRVTIRLAREWMEVPSEFVAYEELKKIYVKKFPILEVDSKVLTGQLLPCSFRYNNRKLLFVSAILSEQTITGPSGVEEEVYALSWPENLQQVQRRFYYRAAVPADMDLKVRVWEPVAEVIGRPSSSPIETAKLIDISVGGAQIEVKSPDKLQIDRSYLFEVELPAPEKPLLIQGQVRRLESLPGRRGYRYGIQFLALNLSPAGRQAMERLARFTNYLRNIAEQRKELNTTSPREI